ncbi:hypothetical protein [Clostridium botulinum]|uniref:hypothetical protein n=1 Tax=Clostridium botulinum TaxID=1491 RepID=UPI000ABEE4D7|nr:hypothetical protein [Clostridium botulinum]
MPISFILYFILKIIEFKWKKKGYSKLVKSIWYITVGLGSLEGDIRVEKLIVMMMFFDAIDSYIEYKEQKSENDNK